MGCVRRRCPQVVCNPLKQQPQCHFFFLKLRLPQWVVIVSFALRRGIMRGPIYFFQTILFSFLCARFNFLEKKKYPLSTQSSFRALDFSDISYGCGFRVFHAKRDLRHVHFTHKSVEWCTLCNERKKNILMN